MKRICFLLCTLLFSCQKQKPPVVYDSHLFTELQAHTWIFDSDKIVRANTSDTMMYASDTAQQTTTFNSQYYTVETIANAVVEDSAAYQIIYDDPKTIYYYNIGGSFLPNQYFTIDTVNSSRLILQQNDTAHLSSLVFYHAQ